MERHLLILRLDELKREIAGAQDELARAERSEITTRIDILEGVLAETRRQVVEARRAVAERSVKSAWPSTLVIAVLLLFLAYHCH
jgi:hypothetical protein